MPLTTLNTFKILQLENSPDILLLNSHGVKTKESLKIPGYHGIKVNSSEEGSDCSAILIKHEIQFKVMDNFDTNFIDIEIDTIWGANHNIHHLFATQTALRSFYRYV